MAERTHRYETTIRWTGDRGHGTIGYGRYSHDHVISVPGKPDVLGSSDPAFRGDASRYNPEDLLVASLSGCHMLWYLHLCAVAGVVVLAYEDNADGVMIEDAAGTDGSPGGGRFSRVTLRPRVTITAASDASKAHALHEDARRLCFIANSVNFPVLHEPTIMTA